MYCDLGGKRVLCGRCEEFRGVADGEGPFYVAEVYPSPGVFSDVLAETLVTRVVGDFRVEWNVGVGVWVKLPFEFVCRVCFVEFRGYRDGELVERVTSSESYGRWFYPYVRLLSLDEFVSLYGEANLPDWVRAYLGPKAVKYPEVKAEVKYPEVAVEVKPVEEVKAEVKTVEGVAPEERPEYRCIILTVLTPRNRFLPYLRRFRDRFLLRSCFGERLVLLYYRFGTWLLKRVGRWE